MKKIKGILALSAAAVLLCGLVSVGLAAADKSQKSMAYEGINIAENSLFDCNNVSPAINDTVSKMKPGEKAYLKYGNYRYSETVNIINENNNLSGCTLELDGVYTQDSAALFKAVSIRAENLKLKINKIVTELPENDFSVTRPTGIHIESAKNCEFEFDEIIGFSEGLFVSPTESGKDVSGNSITFRYIASCSRPILVSAEPGAVSSVHDNVFTGGRLRGDTGLTFFKGESQKVPHTNNVFSTVAFESIEKQGIILDYAADTQILQPRFESVMWINIYESENTSGSRYIGTVAMDYKKLDLYSRNTSIQMPIYNVAWTSSQYWENKINALYLDENGKMSYDFAQRQYIKAGAGRTELPLDIASVDVNAPDAEATLALYSGTDFEDNEIMLFVWNADHGVTVEDYNGKAIYTTKKPGVYRMKYSGGSWNVNWLCSAYYS